MTDDGTQPEIDPRFDPVFQRGYVPDSAALAPDPTPAPDGAAPAPDAAALAPDGAAPAPDAAAPAPDAAALAPDPTPRDVRLNPAAPFSEFGDSADTPQAPVATHGEAAASPNAGMPGAGIADDRWARDSGVNGRAPTDAAAADAARAEPALAAEPIPHTTDARWFWIALGVCAAFIVVGATVYWTQASDPAYFMGGRPGFTQTFQQFVMVMSPSLVQAGVIGIVAVLVAWALRGRHDPRDRETRGRR